LTGDKEILNSKIEKSWVFAGLGLKVLLGRDSVRVISGEAIQKTQNIFRRHKICSNYYFYLSFRVNNFHLKPYFPLKS